MQLYTDEFMPKAELSNSFSKAIGRKS